MAAWLRAPAERRLPLQPWKLERTASDTPVATVPAPDGEVRVTPVAYDAGGIVPHSWPTPESLAAPPLEVRHASDVVVIPRGVYLSSSGELMKRNFAAGRFRNEGLKRLQVVDRYFPRSVIAGAPVATIDGPALAADSPWPEAYGHVLLEIVPTAMLLEYCPPETTIVTTAPRTRTTLAMFAQLGVGADRVRQVEDAILCRDLYFGDRPVRLSGQIHPLAREAYRRLSALAEKSRVQRPERVFVSRAGVHARPLAQQEEVEALFARHGFTIIHPETLPIEDQIALMSGSRMLAGLGGSNMHNAVFAPADCPVLIIQPRLMSVAMDVGICEAPRRLGYVFGDGLPLGDRFVAPWSVQLAAVETAIHLHFEL